MSNVTDRPRLTVLVVEDECLVREVLVAHLQEAECRVVEAENGEAAVKALSGADGFDAVVTDIQLGGDLNGWDVGEASREVHPRIPVIYASGGVVTPERPVPGSVFFRKPYNPEKVVETCRDLAFRKAGQA